MTASTCFCDACERRSGHFSYYIPAIEKHTSQYQEFIRKMNRSSDSNTLFGYNYRKSRNSLNLPNNTFFRWTAEDPINHLVENVLASNETRKEEETTTKGNLVRVDDMIKKRRPNENYIDKNGVEQHYSELMAKLNSELLSVKKLKKKSLKKKTIEIISSWKGYVNKKISFSFNDTEKRKIKSRNS